MQLTYKQAPREALDGLGSAALRFLAPDPNQLFGGNVGMVDSSFVIGAKFVRHLDDRRGGVALTQSSNV